MGAKKAVVISKNPERVLDFLKKYTSYQVKVYTGNPPLWKEVNEIIIDFGRGLPPEVPAHLNVATFEELFEKTTGRVSLEFIEKPEYLEDFLKKAHNKGAFDLFQRATDIIGAVVGGILYLIILPFIILAVKIDSEGPVFYKQKRTGRSGKVFTIWKIRTMVKDAEKGGAVWAKKNDNRITRVGRLLRKTRLDEFPQIWNILKGDMSIVGPRPERPEIEENLKTLIPHYDLRHIVRPGMAGWAMVNHDYVDSVEDAKIRHEYDLYYIKHRGLMLYLKTFLKALTSLLLLKGR